VVFEIFSNHNLIKNLNHFSNFYTWFKQVSQNIEGLFNKKSYLISFRNWLNIFMYHCHFGYNKNSTKNKIK
jgi:hypothetical protein